MCKYRSNIPGNARVPRRVCRRAHRSFAVCSMLVLASYIFSYGVSYAASMTWLNNVYAGSVSLVSITSKVLIAAAFMVFVWGMITFIYAAADDQQREAGKKRMLWGVIALCVMVTIWGILQLMQGIFGIANPTITPPSATML